MRTTTLPVPVLAFLASASIATAAPPEDPIGALLTKAAALDGFKRIASGETFFADQEGKIGKGKSALVLFKFRLKKDHVRLDYVDFSPAARGAVSGLRRS
ncbi:MAG: hypothetical protein JKY65_31905 [Planctomycetes bacterium]|nr:hypothetical protein [Planctomycetota bacterium]